MKTLKELLEECPFGYVYEEDRWEVTEIDLMNFCAKDEGTITRVYALLDRYLQLPYIFLKFPDHKQRRSWLEDMVSKHGTYVDAILTNTCLKNNKRSAIAGAAKVLDEKYIGPEKGRLTAMADELYQETNRNFNTESMTYEEVHEIAHSFKQKIHSIMEFLSVR